MSVLLELAMFPMDKGVSVSPFVTKILSMLKEEGYPHQLNAMGTVVELPSMEVATGVLNKAYAVLEPDCDRVYATAKFDIRKSDMGRLTGKVNKVNRNLGISE